jgi:hypothetical protein
MSKLNICNSNLKVVTFMDYKKGFKEGIKFFKEFPNAGLEMIRYFEKVEPD